MAVASEYGIGHSFSGFLPFRSCQIQIVEKENPRSSRERLQLCKYQIMHDTIEDPGKI
jgi:hypothetical protein